MMKSNIYTQEEIVTITNKDQNLIHQNKMKEKYETPSSPVGKFQPLPTLFNTNEKIAIVECLTSQLVQYKIHKKTKNMN